MLWDVISDEDIFKFLSPDIQSKVYNLFINNIQGFYEVERTKINSLDDSDDSNAPILKKQLQKLLDKVNEYISKEVEYINLDGYTSYS